MINTILIYALVLLLTYIFSFFLLAAGIAEINIIFIQMLSEFGILLILLVFSLLLKMLAKVWGIYGHTIRNFGHTIWRFIFPNYPGVLRLCLVCGVLLTIVSFIKISSRNISIAWVGKGTACGSPFLVF